jgi:hypothetical protein
MLSCIKGEHWRSAIFLVAFGGIHSPSTTAAQFDWKPDARSTMRLEDNVRGTSANPEAAWGFDTGGGVSISRSTGVLRSELKPKFNLRRFIVGSNLDADEYSVALNNEWAGDKFRANVDTSYARDSTLTTEGPDVRRINDVKNRDSLTVAPSITYALSERTSLQSTFLFNDVTYIDAIDSGLVDYQYILGSTGVTYSLWDGLDLFASFVVSNFDVPDLNSTTRSYTEKIGGTWRASESLSMSAALGWILNDIKFEELEAVLVAQPVPRFEVVSVAKRTSSNGPIASVSIEKAFAQSVMRFDYTRQVSPSGRGAQSESDSMAFKHVHNLSQRLSLSLDGLYEIRAAQGGDSVPNAINAGDLNRDYFEVKAGLRYQLTEEWATSASYRFGHRKNTGLQSDIAETNSFYLTVDYNGRRHDIEGGF